MIYLQKKVEASSTIQESDLDEIRSLEADYEDQQRMRHHHNEQPRPAAVYPCPSEPAYPPPAEPAAPVGMKIYEF